VSGRVWLLNLDAEGELAEPLGYGTPRALLERIRDRAHLTKDLLRGDLSLPLETRKRPHDLPRGTPVLPWCPTPSALATIRRLGLDPPVAPPLAVLQKVNHRGFQHELARTLADFVTTSFSKEATFCTLGDDVASTLRDLVGRLNRPPGLGGGWRVERCFGFAGRASRRFTRDLDSDDRRWLREALEKGGALVEPWVPIQDEFSIHGWVDGDGTILGDPCTLVTDAFGAPLRVVRGDSGLSRLLSESLWRAAAACAAALRSAGYFGPFGLDAFTYASGSTMELNPLSDLNARFTLGWSTGMGSLRDAALERTSWTSTSRAPVSPTQAPPAPRLPGPHQNEKNFRILSRSS
jgi:hypothetical protein